MHGWEKVDKNMTKRNPPEKSVKISIKLTNNSLATVYVLFLKL